MDLLEYERGMYKSATRVVFLLIGAIESQGEKPSKRDDGILAKLAREWVAEFSQETKGLGDWLEGEIERFEMGCPGEGYKGRE